MSVALQLLVRLSSTDFPHTSGSLNLVLANKNGFVIAADSRGTHRTSTGVSYRDEYQKLFRTGPRSALAIAGLLAGGTEPFQLETIARILRRFGPAGLSDGRGDAEMVAGWLELEFSYHLQSLAAVLTALKYPGLDLRLIATVAGFDAEGNVIVEQAQFVPDGLLFGDIPRIKPTVIKTVIHDFDWRDAGAPSVAEDILRGHFAIPIRSVVDYLEARKENRLGSVSLDQLRSLTDVVFQETMKRERGVGGSVQIALIPRDGNGQWNLMSNQPLRTTLGGSGLVIGATNPFMTADWRVNYTFVQNRFHDVAVPLDENDYYGNVFERCTLLYSGGTRISYGANTESACAVEIAPGVKHIPPIVDDLKRRCQTARDSTPKRPMLKTPHWTTSSISPH
ncbi:MAG: hypothetical protein DMG58_06840 [Acidobacteria bacterium]|nr:MAG: hypothetical protein DMG58_06840 [Acidobacteriota bacterium]